MEKTNEEIIKEETDRVLNILEELAYEYYFVSPILKNFNLKADPTFSAIAAVDKEGRGLFNPLLTLELEEDQVKFVLLHETFHVILHHVERYERKNGNDYRNFDLWNISADAFINENLSKNLDIALDNMVTFSIAAKMAGIDRAEVIEKSTEDLYDLMLENRKKLEQELDDLKKQLGDYQNQKQQQQNQGSGGQQPQMSGQGGNANNNQEQSSNGGGTGSSEKEESDSSDGSEKNSGTGSVGNDEKDPIEESLENKINNIEDQIEENKKQQSKVTNGDEMKQIEEAFKEERKNERNYGKSNMEEAADKIKKAIENSENDFEFIKDAMNKSIKWKKILKQFVSEVGGKHDKSKTWRRPNKKYQSIYNISKGRVRNKSKSLIFSIDVSGSMDRDKIQSVIKVVNSFAEKNRVKFEYYFFSSYRYDTHEFKDIDTFIKEYRKVCGGGTSFKAAADFGDADGVVVVSDMEFDYFDENVFKNAKIPYKFLDIDPYGSHYAVKKAMSESKEYVEVF